MDDAKKQLAEKLKAANNILVTVSRNPSVDQLAACLGLTLLLDKQGKHAVSVFSGEIPSTIEFLEPDKTLEKNTDSLRDFIIALDKDKADKLRYKVEDNVVRIFITPYKTSISQDDFDFSQGDFNVDVIVALGVREQEDLDQAITAHGRILHDATLTSINTATEGGLGSINWNEPKASSLSELVTDLAKSMGSDLIDNQIATALLTGIVAETDRFSNDKTTSQTMTMSAILMTAGANQQLVASKLEEHPDFNSTPRDDTDHQSDDRPPHDDLPHGDDGMININHHDAELSDEQEHQSPSFPRSEPQDDQSSRRPAASRDKPAYFDSSAPEFDEFTPQRPDELNQPPERPTIRQDHPAGNGLSPGAKMMTEPPTLGGTLVATDPMQAAYDPMMDAPTLPQAEPPQLLGHHNDSLPQGGMPSFSATTEPVPGQPAFALPGQSSAFGGPPSGGFFAAPEPPTPMPTPDPMPAPTPAPTPEPTPAPAWTPPAEPPQALASPVGNDTTLADLEAAVHSPSTPVPDTPDKTLADLEAAVDSAHTAPQGLDAARDEVDRALSGSSDVTTDEPIQSLGAQPLGMELHPAPAPESPAIAPQVIDNNAPPPVPPPIPFQFGNPPAAQ